MEKMSRTPTSTFLALALVLPGPAFASKKPAPLAAPGTGIYRPAGPDDGDAEQAQADGGVVDEQPREPREAAPGPAPQPAAEPAAPAPAPEPAAAESAEKAPAAKPRRARERQKRRAANSKRSRRPASAARAKAGRLIVAGIRRLGAKQFSAAIASFEKAAEADRGSANAFYHLGDAYFQRGFQEGLPERADKDDARRALDAYESALGLDPSLRSVKDPYLLYHGMAQCQEALGDFAKALETLKSAATVAHRNPMPHLYGARIRYKMRDFDMSARNLYFSVRRARKLRAYPQLAKLLRDDPHFTSLLAVPQNKLIVESYDAVAQGVLSEDEAKERIRGFPQYRDALTSLPTRRPQSLDEPSQDPKVLRLIEEAHLAFDHERFRQAIAAYQQALASDSGKGTIDAVQRSLLLERIGASYRRLGLTGEAIRVLRKAVEEQAENSGAYYELSLSYAVQGELGNAMASLNKALDHAVTLPQLRKTLLLARTDSELEPLRDLPKFGQIISAHSQRLRARK